MPAGLYIDFNDGGPPMVITAGMKALIHAGDIPGGAGVSTYLPRLNPAFPTYMIPRETFRFDGHPVNGRIVYLNGFGINGNTVTQIIGGNGTHSSFSASVWQVDQTVAMAGLFISDSSDFTAIGIDRSVGFCVFRGVVTINGSWNPPIPAGAVGVTIFAKFDASNRTLHYNGSQVTCWVNDVAESVSAAVTAKIVIFVSGIEPTPQQGGLNMWNAAGQCTFSSANRPFITYGKTVPITTNWVDTGGDLVQLGNFGGFRYGSDSRNQEWTKALGITMSGNGVMVGKAHSISVDTGYNSTTYQTYYVSGLSALTIPDIYI